MGQSYARKAEGVATVAMPYGEIAERKTATCGHCQRIFYVQPGTDGTSAAGPVQGPALCHRCWSLVCPRCHKHGRCTPWLKQMERIEARGRFLRSAGLE